MNYRNMAVCFFAVGMSSLAFACGDDGEESESSGGKTGEAGERSTGGRNTGGRIGSGGSGGAPAAGAAGDATMGGASGGTGPVPQAGEGGEAGERGGGSDDDCSPNLCLNGATCTLTATSYRCNCATGFTGSFCENDIDECATNNGGCNLLATCRNTFGGFTCGDCPRGYDEAPNGDCVDIDECLIDNGGCDFRSTCQNEAGGRDCSGCPDGYTGSGEFGCDDINECLDDDACDPLTNCTNLSGTYRCSACPTGYDGNSMDDCEDINECATNNGGCDPVADCANLPGTFECGDCPTGYTGEGDTGCYNIDECDDPELFECDEGYECDDTEGSYECDDIDECAAEVSPCNPGEVCENTAGSYTCGNCDEDEDCADGLFCDAGLCASAGELGISAVWDTLGDGDLWIQTPTGALIFYDNPGPDGATDFGVYEIDAADGGPENTYWPDGSTPPAGLYHVCFETLGMPDPVIEVIITVRRPELPELVHSQLVGNMNDMENLDPQECTPAQDAYILSFGYPDDV